MRSLLALIFLTTSANAHAGHVGDFLNHDPWVIGAAVGAAIAAGVYGALKGKEKEPEEAELEVEE